MSSGPGRKRGADGVPLGFFLTLEGIEGSGKTTHAELLGGTLVERGYPVTLTREPGGTDLGESARALILDHRGEAPVPEAELFLILAARAQHVHKVVLPRLNRGDVVICDRYSDASLAYQGGGRGLGVPRVAAANDLATGGLVPDLTVVFDLPVTEAMERVHRRQKKGGAFNRFDREEESFYTAVRDTYLSLARNDPDRFRVLSSLDPESEVAEKLLEMVEPLLRTRFGAGT